MTNHEEQLGVGVLGAGGWSEAAHLPSYADCERARLVAISDVVPARAHALAQRFGIAKVYSNPWELIADPEVQMVDVCTSTDTHAAMSLAVIEAGKHVLSEKPLAEGAKAAFSLAAAAQRHGVRTKVAYTFRYSPAIRQLARMIEESTLGEVFHVHGLEQNAQFLDPRSPLRQVPIDDGTGNLLPSSVVEYGSHLVNLMRACGGEVRSVVSSMQCFVPERLVRGLEGMQRLPLEDATVALLEFASGAHGMLQTSHVAVGAGPGVEIRVYGSKGAAIARLVAERGVPETLRVATPDAPEFRDFELPGDDFGARRWHVAPPSQAYFRRLVRHFVDEVLDAGRPECDFTDGAKSQQLVDTLIQAHRERRWIDVEA